MDDKRDADKRTPSFKVPSLRFSVPQQTVRTRVGGNNSTGGLHRQKVRLKPGHSALDWHRLTIESGSKGKLISCLLYTSRCV